MIRVAVIILFFCFHLALAKAQALSSPECQELFFNKPPLAITYERLDRGDKKSRNALFRIRNVSPCDLILYDQIGHSLRWQKTPQGGMSFEQTNFLLPDREMPILYGLKASRNAKNIYSNGDSSCLIYSRILSAKQTTLLAIPFGILQKFPKLWIEFDYSWQSTESQVGIQQKRFVAELRLPRSVMK